MFFDELLYVQVHLFNVASWHVDRYLLCAVWARWFDRLQCYYELDKWCEFLFLLHCLLFPDVDRLPDEVTHGFGYF